MLLQVNHLDAFYGRLQALWDVSVEVEQGEIIERGTHEELLEKKGRYYQLYTGKAELE